MRSTKNIVFTLAAASLSLSTCSAVQPVANPSANSLGNAVYALHFSAPSTELDQKNQYGKVVLVNKDGSVSAIPTWGMDYGTLTWTDQALVFSDMKNDYRLDKNELKSIPSEKTDSQYSLLATDTNTVVGIYNFGFSDEGGYGSQIVTTSNGKSSVKEIEGGYYVTANCDGIVYGTGRATGPYSETGDPETEPVMLNQLTDTADGKELNIGMSKDARDNAVAPDAPCIDNKIYYISDAVGGGLEDPMKPVLSIWDITSGEYRDVPLRAEGLDKPLMSHEDAGYPQITAESIIDGKLEWFGVGNSIMSTDLKTGATEKKFEVAGFTDNSVRSRAVFHKGEVIQLVEPHEGGKYEVIRYDRRTGEELERSTINMDVADVHDGLFLRGFAIKP